MFTLSRLPKPSNSGNGNTVAFEYKPLTDASDMEYLWNKVGSLKQRADSNRSLTEIFLYDNLHRLDRSTLNGASNLDVNYDLMGNITSKDDVGSGTWIYHATKKHAVINAAGNSYSYDANGNQVMRNSNTVTWTSYNYPSEIEDGAKTYQYFYDGSRRRWKTTYDNGVQSETTVFVAGIMEKRTEGTFTQYRHYIHVGNQAVAVYARDTGGGEFTNYFLLDHMGSVAAITNDAGGYYVDESFSAYGDRRDPNDWSGQPSAGDKAAIADVTQRGFTFHTNAEASSFIHMNGRVADSLTGRFLSADPYIFGPGMTQSYNRYSYVLNDPLSFTDPSGFCLEGLSTAICRSIITSVVSFVSDWLSGDDEPPKLCETAGATCYGQAPSTKLKDFTSDVVAVVDFLRSPRIGFGGNMGGAGLGGFGGGGGGFGTGGCPPSMGPHCMSWGGFDRLPSWGQLEEGGSFAFRILVFDFEDPLGGSYILEAATLIPIFKVAKLVKLRRLGHIAENARVPNGADDFVDLTTSQRRKHILDGDATGGGHRAGTGNPGKSEFPADWSDDRIIHEISDVATDPHTASRVGRGGRIISEGTRDGVNIRTVVDKNGEIITGYPTNVPRNR